MTATEVYLRRGRAQTKRQANPKSLLSKMRKTLTLRILATGAKGKDLVHVMIRKKFIADGNQFSELAFISLVKQGMIWKVSLDAQDPKVIPVAKSP